MAIKDIINNYMEIPKIQFTSLEEIKTFLKMNKTDLANYYAGLMKDNIKIVGKEQDVHFYDSKTKLWRCQTKEVYDGFMADYLNETGKTLKDSFNKLIKDLKDDEDNEECPIRKMKKKMRSEINDILKEFDSQAYINTIITRSTGKLQDNKFVTKLNSNIDYLPIKNGRKINLKNGEITERTKSDLFSFECPVDVVNKTDNADKFFRQVMPDNECREFLRKVLGYQLTGNMDGRVFFIWYGDGSNGKSVIFRLLKCILGPLYHQCGKGIFMKGSQEKVDGPSPDKIALIGVRVAAYSEGETADDIDINESFMKMVSGRDEVNARALFRAPLTFFPVCKLDLLTNYKPDLNGDKSMKERVRYIFLDSSFVDVPNPKRKNEFKRNDDFIESLCSEFLSEVFTWILKGSIEYYKTKTIIPPAEFQKRTDEFFSQQDSITSFIKCRLQVTENDKDYIKRGELFEIYQQYCKDNSQRCHPRSTLFKRLEDLRIRIVKRNGYDVYRGVKITTVTPHDDKPDPDYDKGVDTTDKSVKQVKQEDNEEDEKPKKIKKTNVNIKQLDELL